MSKTKRIIETDAQRKKLQDVPELRLSSKKNIMTSMGRFVKSLEHTETTSNHWNTHYASLFNCTRVGRASEIDDDSSTKVRSMQRSGTEATRAQTQRPQNQKGK